MNQTATKRVSASKAARVVYAADFETTTVAEDCRVWVWGLADVENPDSSFEWDKTLDSFMHRIARENSICYFHNLKFDGHFMLDWLLRNDYEHIETEGRISFGMFKTLISDMGKFFSITVKWKNGKTTEFRDSLKKLPMTVAKVAKAFKMEESKGEIDYHLPRPIGYEPTPEEIDYLKRDVVIVGKAVGQTHANGMKRLTVASDSLAEYKRLIGADSFIRIFPQLSESMDSEIRRAYRGGWAYADPRFKGKVTRSGIVLDVNSLYPAVMKNAVLPFGEPEFIDGKVEPTKGRPLTIFSVTFTAKLKPDHLACIQIKGMSMFAPTEYLTEISEPTTLMLTNIDLALYQEHYDMDILEYGGGWRFHGAQGLFDEYIDKWSRIKEHSEGGIREIAKLHLNSLYGKFASNPNVTSKNPSLQENKVKLTRGKDAKRPPIYTAMGVFITSYARNLTIRAAQENYGTFAYADTDSLHLLQDDIPTTIDVHPSKMGSWKLEYAFDSAYYIRPKAYLERKTDGTYKNALAGVPEHVSAALTFDDIEDGRVLHGKLVPHVVPGGVVLKDVPFKLVL